MHNTRTTFTTAVLPIWKSYLGISTQKFGAQSLVIFLVKMCTIFYETGGEKRCIILLNLVVRKGAHGLWI